MRGRPVTPTTLSLPVVRHQPARGIGSIATTRFATIERLRPLLHEAAELDLDDRLGWMRLRDAARQATGELVATAGLPPHLAVTAVDPPAVVARTLAIAWRHATTPAELRHLRA